MADLENTLFFIPDISGFTRFVGTTELTHSRHIVAELLEVLIDADTLGLTVAEIEGDAVLFYKREPLPELETIFRQAEMSFLAFHNHLARYERHRICDCGACATASRLSVKFIVHVGISGQMRIKHFEKPYGPALVTAHRLLKNSIGRDEYLLVTDAVAEELPEPWQLGSDHYEYVGSLRYYSYSLEHLHARVIPVPDFPPFTPDPHSISTEILLPYPADTVYQELSNLDLRTKWQPGLRRVKFKTGRVNRVGTSHLCVLPVGTAHFRTVYQEGPYRRQLAESTRLPLMREVRFVYQLEEISPEKTQLKLSVHFFPRYSWAKVLTPLYRKMIRPTLVKNLRQFRLLLDDMYRSEPGRTSPY